MHTASEGPLKTLVVGDSVQVDALPLSRLTKGKHQCLVPKEAKTLHRPVQAWGSGEFDVVLFVFIINLFENKCLSSFRTLLFRLGLLAWDLSDFSFRIVA